jgi:hypothetical protein
MKKHLIQIVFVLTACYARGQTFVYDQQVATSDTGGNGITTPIQTQQPIGQSFVPALSSVGFVRLYLTDQTAGGIGATVFLNLWSGSISNGTLMASSDPIFIPNGFFNYANFFFSTPVSVTPGMTYYFQPFIQSGDSDNNFDIGVVIAGYGNGTVFFNGISNPNEDLWFREGVVPEPSVISLIALSATGLYLRHRKPRNLVK